MRRKNDEDSSLSHTVWNCQYHFVFCPKYRRKAIYGKIRSDIGKYLRGLCAYKGTKIIEANDHIHILKKNTTQNEYIKFDEISKSALMNANLKYNYGNKHFWTERYCVSTIELNKVTIKNTFENKKQKNMIKNKMSIKDIKIPSRDSKSDKEIGRLKRHHAMPASSKPL